MEDEVFRLYNEELSKANIKNDQKNIIPAMATQSVENNSTSDPSGGIIVNVSTLRRLYPVPGAVVTIFTGPYEQMNVIEKAVTDKSGKTGVFRLSAPQKALSESAAAVGQPYSDYNISVKADGYVEQINLNVPVFPGIVSMQSVDLLPISAEGIQTGPIVFDEHRNYDL